MAQVCQQATLENISLAATVFVNRFLFDPNVHQESALIWHDRLIFHLLNIFQNHLQTTINGLLPFSILCFVCVKVGFRSWIHSQTWLKRVPEAIQMIKSAGSQMQQSALADKNFVEATRNFLQIGPSQIADECASYMMHAAGAWLGSTHPSLSTTNTVSIVPNY